MQTLLRRLHPKRFVSSGSKKQHQLVVPEELRKSMKTPWVEVKDSQKSGLVYYWNRETNETTALGAPKPQHWVELRDPNGSELTYWWNPETNQTTSLGVPKPNTIQINSQFNQYQSISQPQSLGSRMKTYFALGIGVSTAFALVGALFR
jgi:hypothetical protein